MGLRVITVEGAPTGLRHSAIRAFLGVIDFYLTFGGGAVLCILLSQRDQRLGDLVAGTLVIRERTGAAQPAPVWFMVPPGYEHYAATLDVSGLSAAEYGAVRAFLVRAGSLDPYRRFDLARQMATPLLGRLRHTRPAGVGAEALLACVAAVYQARQRQAAASPWRPPLSAEPPPGAAPQGPWAPAPAPVAAPPAAPPVAWPPTPGADVVPDGYLPPD
jgi:hypothetical protein